MNNTKMLYYSRIEISEGTDVNKTSASKESFICYFWYFLDKRFKFQPSISTGCRDVLTMSINFNHNAILNIYGIGYRCIINGTSKSKVVNLLKKR